MIESLRNKFNLEFTDDKYQSFLRNINEGFSPIPFKISETPVFIPLSLKKQLVDAGETIFSFIKDPKFKNLTQNSIPEAWEVSNENDHPHFLAFDFAICTDEDKNLEPKLIEIQGFPSLFGFQNHLANNYKNTFDIKEELSHFFNNLTEEKYIELLKKVIVGNHNPKHVALMDVNASKQNTAIDFYLTHEKLGIKILSLTDIKKDGKKLYYIENEEKVYLKRIFNRLIFDELNNDFKLFDSCFDPREELDIEWITHPNWFYRVSKYTLPFLKHNFVPDTFFLNDISSLPTDLQNFVLKPLFSFAGSGVILNVTKKDIDNIKDPHNWILQKKVTYAPIIKTPDGNAKVEIRLLYIWPDGEEPQLCLNMARLSKGEMIGLQFNKNFDWVGGSIGFME